MDERANPHGKEPESAAALRNRPDGSHGLMLRCFYHTLRISVPTVLDAMRGKLTPAASDSRLRDWSETLIRLTQSTLLVSGLEHIPQQACIVMSNHQSLSDIPVLFAALPLGLRLRMVAKEELFRVPIWGRAMRLAGFIPINRGNRERAIASLELAKQAMAGGTFIWIAPEGTRSRTGALGQLKKGGFILARDTGCPILPIVVSGSRHIVPTQGLKAYLGSQVRVTIKPLITVTDRPLEEVMAEVARAIDPA